MPSFNQAAYLEEAIRSVLDQKYPALEFFLLDGGSTDGSRGIVERYEHVLTHWRSAPDRGQSAALVEGFGMASGELLGWLNSDDVLLPGALMRLGHAFARSPDTALLGGNYILIDERGLVIRCKRHPRHPEPFLRLGFIPIAQPGSLFTAEAYQAVGGLDPDLRYVMDADLYFRIIRGGGRFTYLDSWLSGFRKHSKAKTVAEWDQTLAEFRPKILSYGGAGFPLGFRSPWGRAAMMTAQTLNANYPRMLVESISARGKPWKEWAVAALAAASV
jgi:glycosyltransferase involved in cell wall biosynthesis